MICRRESGQVLLLATMSMVVLLGFSALAVDIGLLYSYTASNADGGRCCGNRWRLGFARPPELYPGR
jgi:hypothetical protein